MNDADVSRARSSERALPAWVAMLLACLTAVPGVCPACWPGYVGLISSAGLGVLGEGASSGILYLSLSVLVAVPLGVQILRRRDLHAGAAAIVGLGLIVEARWLGGNRSLHALGTILLIGSALVATRRTAPAVAPLIQIRLRGGD